MDKLKMRSVDKVEENIKKISALFPNTLTEVIKGYRADGSAIIEKAIDFDLLRQQLSDSVVEGTEERYQFTWPDKKKSILLANASIAKTLRPIREGSVDFDHTENLYIEGDNLEALKLLQETYLGKVKMIYIDPPYNTGNDFIYEDDFAQSKDEYLANSGQFDEEGNRLVQNTDSNGRFHTDWLNMLYPRLMMAKDLLSDDGVILISIDDNEVDNLKKICNEVFGERNFLGQFIINSTPNARDYGHIGKMHEYVLFYGKNELFTTTNMLPEEDKTFKYNDETGGFNIHPLYNSNEAFNKSNRPNLYYPFYLYLDEPVGDDFYHIGLDKKENSIELYPPTSKKNGVQFVWRWGKEKALKNLNKEIIGYKTGQGEYRIVQKMRHTEKIIRSLLTDKKYSSRRGTAEVESIMEGKIFSFPKPLALLYDFIKIATDEDSIVLDIFSGSATTAHALLHLNAEDNGNRKFIMMQLPEETDENSTAYQAGFTNICEIGKERIRRAGKRILEEHPEVTDKLDIGFRVLRVDSTNMQDVYYNPNEYSQSILPELEDNIKPDRTPEDLLFQVMLDLGVIFSSKIEETVIEGKKVFNVADGYLMACFDTDVTSEVITEIAKKQPYYAVFRDSSLANDSVVTNFEQIFETYSPTTERKVL